MKKNFIDLIGNTPLFYIKSLSDLTGCEIYGKAEFMNPGGSIKDRAALGIIEDAEKKGLLKPGGLIVEGTTGNTGIGLALIGNIKGYRTKIIIPNTQAPEKVDVIRGMGAEVLFVPSEPWPSPENYQNIAKRIAEEEGGFYANQFDNIANTEAHFKTTGPEIWSQTQGGIDAFICAMGTGGTLSGISTYLKSKNPGVQIGVVDIEKNSAMYSHFVHGKVEFESGETIVEGIGQGRVCENVRPAQVDFGYHVDDQTILDMVNAMIKHEGLFIATSTGANLCGAYLAAKRLGPGKRIVTILCDSGQKYASKIFNPKILAQKGLSVRNDLHTVTESLDRVFSKEQQVSGKAPRTRADHDFNKGS